MIILLDENFPLRFYTRLQREGFSVEPILLTTRGIHDRDIMVRLEKAELLFFTQDQDFMDVLPDCKASIILSRVCRSRWKLIDESKFGSKPQSNFSPNNGMRNSLSSTMTEFSIRLRR